MREAMASTNNFLVYEGVRWRKFTHHLDMARHSSQECELESGSGQRF